MKTQPIEQKCTESYDSISTKMIRPGIQTVLCLSYAEIVESHERSSYAQLGRVLYFSSSSNMHLVGHVAQRGSAEVLGHLALGHLALGHLALGQVQDVHGTP